MRKPEWNKILWLDSNYEESKKLRKTKINMAMIKKFKGIEKKVRDYMLYIYIGIRRKYR